MGRIVRRDEVVRSLYINPLFPNNFIINYLYDILDLISSKVPRKVNYKMISTYQKGIEHLHRQENGQEVYTNIYPSMIITPGQLKIDERINCAWHTQSQISEAFITKHFKPYVEIGNLAIYPVTNRYNFNFEVTYLAESYLELTDIILHMNREFNTRYRYYNNISKGTLYLPDAMVKHIDDEYGHELLMLNSKVAYTYNATYNRGLYGVPWKINSHIKLLDYSDGSNYFGDQELPSYRITFTFESFLQIPNHLVATFNPIFNVLQFNFDVSRSKTDPVTLFNLTSIDLEKNETIIFHSYDFGDGTFEIAFTEQQLSPAFIEFKPFKIHIKSGLSYPLTSTEFDYVENMNNKKKIFTFMNIDSKEYVITVIGKYDPDLLEGI